MARVDLDVVIPTNSFHPYLKDAVDSALQQKGADVHVIVVDDGSDDETGAQVKSWQLPQVSVAHHDRNRGPAAARNTGVSLSERQWVGFLDSDDLWPHDRTERLAGQSPHQGGLLIGHQQVFDVDSPPDPGTEFPVSGTRPTLLAGAMLFPRIVLERVGPFDDSLLLGEFVDWMRRARDLGIEERSVACVSLLRRSHAANITRTRSDSYRDYLTVVARALRDRGLRQTHGRAGVPSPGSHAHG